MKFRYERVCDIIKVEIKDTTFRTIYKNKFSIRDKNAIKSLLSILERYSGFSIAQILKERIENNGEWF